MLKARIPAEAATTADLMPTSLLVMGSFWFSLAAVNWIDLRAKEAGAEVNAFADKNVEAKANKVRRRIMLVE